jgi:hypothetical protein
MKKQFLTAAEEYQRTMEQWRLKFNENACKPFLPHRHCFHFSHFIIARWKKLMEFIWNLPVPPKNDSVATSFLELGQDKCDPGE